MNRMWVRMAGDGGASALSQFVRHENSDGYGDLVHAEMQVRDPGQLALMTLQDANSTGGFNANGWIKEKGAKVVPY